MRHGTGGTLGDFMARTTPAERAAWQQHFLEFPPGDYLTHRLLANIGAVLSQGQVPARDFAPWLKWDEPKPQVPEGPDLEIQALEALADRAAAGRA
ncbi:MAG: hypothetical protein OXF51_06010 [Alphaproteobacteria bacterium]|nr:hypothetical protein [Alphaproteobacteria bacterium]